MNIDKKILYRNHVSSIKIRIRWIRCIGHLLCKRKIAIVLVAEYSEHPSRLSHLKLSPNTNTSDRGAILLHDFFVSTVSVASRNAPQSPLMLGTKIFWRGKKRRHFNDDVDDCNNILLATETETKHYTWTKPKNSHCKTIECHHHPHPPNNSEYGIKYRTRSLRSTTPSFPSRTHARFRETSPRTHPPS